MLRNLVRVLRQTSKPACQLLMDSCWTGYVKNDVLDISSSDEALQKRAKAKAKPCRLLRPQAPDCLGEVRAFLSLERPIMCPTQHCREKSDSETSSGDHKNKPRKTRRQSRRHKLRRAWRQAPTEVEQIQEQLHALLHELRKPPATHGYHAQPFASARARLTHAVLYVCCVQAEVPAAKRARTKSEAPPPAQRACCTCV